MTTKSAAPAGAIADSSLGFGFQDIWKRTRVPTPKELLEELKNTAWVCAAINASVCATYAPALYVATSKSQPQPKCKTAPVEPHLQRTLRERRRLTKTVHIE